MRTSPVWGDGSGLAPFALVFVVAFGLAFLHLVGNAATRSVALLIFLGFSIFVAVAGMEFLEHLETFRHHFWRRVRQVGEEAAELVAMGLLITAGLMAMRRMGDPDRRFMNATRVVERLLDYPFIMFLVFVAQIVLTAAAIVPNYSFFPEGNVSALYPMLMFFCLGILCMQQAECERRGFYGAMAALFFLTSALQLYNLNRFLNDVFSVQVPLLTGPLMSWLVTVIPYLALSLRGLQDGVIERRQVLVHLLLFFLLTLLLYADLEYRFRLEYHYFLFSSGVAWSAYLVMRALAAGRR